MHLTLIVPGLLWPREILRDTTFDLPHPALSLLLGRGLRSTASGEDSWIAEHLHVALPLPSAALRLLGDGGDPGRDDWLCLDPVHLRIEERAITLDDPARLELDSEEDRALRAAVAPCFARLGELVAPTPGRWYLCLREPATPVMPTPATAIGLQVDPTLPSGNDGREWRRLLASVQPLLRAHPVNQRRLEANHPTVDSLWPWGGGRLPAAADANYRTLWSDDPVLKGFARIRGMVAEAPPPSFTVVRGHVLARFDKLTTSLSMFDAMAWRHSLAELEENWLAPALAAMKGGVLRRLTLVLAGRNEAIETTIRRHDLWRIWRQPLTLSELPA